MLLFVAQLAISGPPNRDSATPPSCVRAVSELPVPAELRGDKRLHSSTLIVVQKKARTISLFGNGLLAQLNGASGCWWVGLGSEEQGWTGTKTKQGDMKTPEGFYTTSDKPWSQFYGAIAVHYPDSADAKRARQAGVISLEVERQIKQATNSGKKPPQNTPLGGEILVHGGGGSTDWTLGCVAMNNTDLDLLRSALPTSMATTILILP